MRRSLLHRCLQCHEIFSLSIFFLFLLSFFSIDTVILARRVAMGFIYMFWVWFLFGWI